MDRAHGGHSNNKITLLVIIALFLTVTCLVGIFVEEAPAEVERPEAVPYVAAAGVKESPRVVGGFVPDRHMGPPPQKQEAEILSWDLINGLFAVIIFLELVVFPFLFWLWFGKEQHTESK